MVKRKFWIILVLSLLLVGAKKPPVRTVRLTIVNKSGLPVEISLTGKNLEYSYYVRVPEGDRIYPSEYWVDVIPDTYSMLIYYKELWDPVYGYDCTEGGKSAEINHATRLTFLGCTYSPPNRGEQPSILKYPQGGRCGGRGPKKAPQAASDRCQ